MSELHVWSADMTDSAQGAHLGAGSLLGAPVVVLGLDLGQVLQLGLLVEQQAAHLGQVLPPPLGLLHALSLHPEDTAVGGDCHHSTVTEQQAMATLAPLLPAVVHCSLTGALLVFCDTMCSTCKEQKVNSCLRTH